MKKALVACKYCKRKKVEPQYQASNPFCSECVNERLYRHEVEKRREEDAKIRDMCRPLIGSIADAPPGPPDYVMAPTPLSKVVRLTLAALESKN